MEDDAKKLKIAAALPASETLARAIARHEHEVPAAPAPPEVPDFRTFHDEMRMLRRRGWRRTDLPTTGYVRPKAEGEVKGKAARKAAKRERVKAMKAAQAEEA
jgi:hypothetical protein